MTTATHKNNDNYNDNCNSHKQWQLQLTKTKTTATHKNNDNYNDNCNSQKQWQLQLTKTKTTATHKNNDNYNDNCNSHKQWQLQLTKTMTTTMTTATHINNDNYKSSHHKFLLSLISPCSEQTWNKTLISLIERHWHMLSMLSRTNHPVHSPLDRASRAMTRLFWPADRNCMDAALSSLTFTSWFSRPK